MGLRYAYNTNGLAHHGLDDALEMLAENGYDGVALTLDHGRLDPFAPGAADELERVGGRLRELGLGCVIETGAFFLLDPRAKHQPTLVSLRPERRAQRVDFLRRAVRVAGALGGEAVSFFSGVPGPDDDRAQAWEWMVEGIDQVLPLAGDLGVDLALEPEPLMLVEDVLDFQRLVAEVPALGLALDAGHCVVTGPPEPHEAARLCAPHLRALSVAGMRRGVHEHLPLDVGDLDLPALLGTLSDVGYSRLVSAELSGDAPSADVLVPRSIQLLRAAEEAGRSGHRAVA